jgi:cation:H+ antiporter
MIIQILLLLISLGLILLAAEGFTNGVEALGRKFSLSQAFVGSILAAVGTALPETILPIVAIISAGNGAGKEIGVGAILGAPFMLSTLAFFLIGLTVVITYLNKRRKFEINVEYESTRRDLSFFIVMYASAVFVPLFTGRTLAVPMALLLFAGYLFYVHRTAHGTSAAVEHLEGLYLQRFFNKCGFFKTGSPLLFLMVAQIILALVIMVSGAQMFVKYLGIIAIHFGLNPLLFALILAPIATELPEKFNSISWTLKKKDSLALGNITGAMVFQSTFPVSVGLLFTEWHLTGRAILSAVIALVSASLVLANLITRKRISPFTLLFPGVLYVIYMLVLSR